MDSRKVAKLFWALSEWNIRNPTYPSSVQDLVLQLEVTYTLLGIEGYVSEGRRLQKTSLLVYCVGCGTCHRLPVTVTYPMVPHCIKCAPSYIDPYARANWLCTPERLLPALPEEVEDAFYDILADKYFAQLDK